MKTKTFSLTASVAAALRFVLRFPCVDVALAVGLGAASVWAFAPFDVFPLMIATLAGLFALWRDASPRRAAVLGGGFGLGFFLAGVSWVYVSLHTYGGMPAVFAGLSTVLFCAYLALYPALAGAAFATLRRGTASFDVLLLASTWTLAEWLRGWVGTGFPWLAIGYSQTPPSPLAGFAPVLGVYGVGFVVAVCAAAIALGCRAGGHAKRAGAWVGGLMVAGFSLGLIHWTTPLPREISVALMQTNIDQGQKWRPELLGRWLRDNAELVWRNPARLMVLPETTLPLLTEDLPEGYLAELGKMARAAGGDLLLGVFERNAAGQIFNSALSLGVSPTQRYAKQHLVPFGEFSPPLFSWVYQLLHMPMSDQTAGPANPPPLELAGEKVAVNICYEDVFGNAIARAAPAATMMLNLSNLAWYGDSFAQPQHLQIARIRALETGRPMLRATNTGMTAIIDPNGSVRAQLPGFTRGAVSALVRGYEGLTPYVRLGDGVIVGLCALVCALAQWARYRATRHAARI